MHVGLYPEQKKWERNGSIETPTLLQSDCKKMTKIPRKFLTERPPWIAQFRSLTNFGRSGTHTVLKSCHLIAQPAQLSY